MRPKRTSKNLWEHLSHRGHDMRLARVMVAHETGGQLLSNLMHGGYLGEMSILLGIHTPDYLHKYQRIFRLVNQGDELSVRTKVIHTSLSQSFLANPSSRGPKLKNLIFNLFWAPGAPPNRFALKFHANQSYYPE